MSFREIQFEDHGDVAVIRINRPEVRNCIGPVTHQELIEAWTTFRDDPRYKVAILTGAGDKAFCSGADLKQVDRDHPDRRSDIPQKTPGLVRDKKA